MKKSPRTRWKLLLLFAISTTSGVWWLEQSLMPAAEAADEPYAATARAFGKGGPAEVVRALEQLGSPTEEAESVARAVGRRLGKGWSGSFVVAAANDGTFHHLTVHRGKKRAVVGRGSKGVKAVPVQERRLAAEGEVKDGVTASLAKAGAPEELILDFLDAFRWSADLVADAQDGDRFKLIWTERAAGGRAYGRRLDAAVYESKEAGRLIAIRWDGQLFDEEGRSVRRPFLKAPVRYRTISSAFGGFRFSPLGWPMRRHRGIDFAAPAGTPIVSVADGSVAFAGRLGEYGNLVTVRHQGGRETFYGHLSRFGPGLRKGIAVRQGQVLGYVGTTGNATGPHLHFELRKDGATEDFRTAKLTSRPQALARRPRRFAAHRRELLGE